MRKVLAAAVLTVLFVAHSLAFGPEGVPRITVDELKSRMGDAAPPVILDVRSKSSYEISNVKVKGAVRIPPGELEARADELPADREIVAYCT